MLVTDPWRSVRTEGEWVFPEEGTSVVDFAPFATSLPPSEPEDSWYAPYYDVDAGMTVPLPLMSEAEEPARTKKAKKTKPRSSPAPEPTALWAPTTGPTPMRHADAGPVRAGVGGGSGIGTAGVVLLGAAALGIGWWVLRRR